MFTIVKLNAINSTNSYLKEWAKTELVKNATVVVAEKQLKGKGQRQSRWQSEPSKNLTFSILYRFNNLKLTNQIFLNCAISSAVYAAIFPIIGKILTVKWPNDIMAGDKKLGGILIENTVINGYITQSIIGIGLNVNQVIFPKNLTHATSLRLILKKEFDLDIILRNILNTLYNKLNMIELKLYNALFDLYNQNLYRIDIWSDFIDDNQNIFKGKIKGVNLEGALVVELIDGKLKLFTNKTIRFL